ncbi:MAG: protein kinase [Deltaproteobacteria bacterium]|nr:protein kinase [Deltaproteobacteria bacterium]
MSPQIDKLINNKYRLVRLIGEGGMGSVWEARHELLGTSVALKFLHGALAKRKGLVERFLQEAQVSARIKSPHVVQVSDVDRASDGLAFMVMELIEGVSLQARYEALFERGERLEYGTAFEVMLQLLEGVGAAHRLGIVHRDLKPDNVMLLRDAKGRTLVKILDFGIAKLKASGEVDRGLTRPGMVMGTPEYMAPEQAFSADKVDARADVFSLGVMFFEMLAGRRPVGGDDTHAIVSQYIEGRVPRLRELKSTIAEGLEAAVHRAMAATADERFASVEEFAAAIAPFAPEGTQPFVGRGGAEALAETADQTTGGAGAARVTGAPVGVPSNAPGASGALQSGDPASRTGGPVAGSQPTTPTGTTAMPMVADLVADGGLMARPQASTAPAMPVMLPLAGAPTPSPRPGGTQLGEAVAVLGGGNSPQAMPSPMAMQQHGSAAVALPPHPHAAPSPYPQHGAPQAFGPPPAVGRAGPRRGGRSMGAILVVAGLLTALVIGGLFVAQSLMHSDDGPTSSKPHSSVRSSAGEPTVIEAAGTPPAGRSPPPSEPEMPATPSNPTTPPGTTAPGKPGPRPTPSGTPTGSATATPSGTPTPSPSRPGPWVLPSQLPELPPGIPGLPKMPFPFPGAPPPASPPPDGN